MCFVRKLGEGCFAQVDHVVIDGQDYAVKTTSKLTADLVREIDILSRVRHPYILPCRFFRHSGREVSIYMPKAKGHVSPDSSYDLFKIAHCILSALNHLHRHGIAHLDVKPENILVQGCNYILSDFNLSSYMLPGIRLLRGSVRYCAPEISINRSPEFASDVWSLGVTLLRLATGKHMVKSKGEMGSVKRLPLLLKRISNETLVRMISEMVEVDPAKRITISEIYERYLEPLGYVMEIVEDNAPQTTDHETLYQRLMQRGKDKMSHETLTNAADNLSRCLLHLESKVTKSGLLLLSTLGGQVNV